MARQLIPQHDPSATITFVPEDDEAWDRPRITEEQQRMRDAGEDPSQHPYARYCGGVTRFDLSAPQNLLGQVVRAGDYLDGAKRPWRFTLRRLRHGEYDDVTALISRGDDYQAWTLACRIGVTAIENVPYQLRGGGKLPLHEQDMEWLHGQALKHALGRAVWLASLPLTDAEKKA